LLIHVVMTGRPAAWDTARLYRCYARDVGRWAARWAQSTSDADDIVQEVFLTVHRQAGRAAELRSPPAWLAQITRNVVRHVWRTRGRAARWAGTCDVDEVVSPSPDPLEQLERRRVAEQVGAAVDALGEGYRQVLWLSDLQELPAAQVAALTGLERQTLRVRRFRARRQLARLVSSTRAAP
jgi:RNA polymerase sigma-70 factor (ECF subfamily)